MVRLKLNTTENLDCVFLSPIALYLMVLFKCKNFIKHYDLNSFLFLYLSVLPGNIFEYTWSTVDEEFLIKETKKNKKYDEMKIQIAVNTIPIKYLSVWDGKISLTENKECELDLTENDFLIIEDTLNHFSLSLFNGNIPYEKVLEVVK